MALYKTDENGNLIKIAGRGDTSQNIKISDIINNLTSTSTTNPLSANQGRLLKTLIDDGMKRGLEDRDGAALDYYASWCVPLFNIIWSNEIISRSGTLKLIGGQVPAKEGNKTIYFRMSNTSPDLFSHKCLYLGQQGIRTGSTANAWDYCSISNRSSATLLSTDKGSYWFAIGY